MRFEELRAILPPPSAPKEIDPSGWASVEERLGTALPDDYKAFIDLYGTGRIANFLVVLNPFSVNEYANLLVGGRRDLKAYVESKADFPKYYTHDAFPEKGGLLPFGSTDNGDSLYWKTVGEPGEWSVVIYESRGSEFFEFSGGMVDCLTLVLSGRLVCGVFPRGFPGSQVGFRSIA